MGSLPKRPWLVVGKIPRVLGSQTISRGHKVIPPKRSVQKIRKQSRPVAEESLADLSQLHTTWGRSSTPAADHTLGNGRWQRFARIQGLPITFCRFLKPPHQGLSSTIPPKSALQAHRGRATLRAEKGSSRAGGRKGAIVDYSSNNLRCP